MNKSMDLWEAMFKGPQPQNEQEEKDLETAIKWHQAMMGTQQHDDHIWLNVGGRSWAIHSMNEHGVTLWRGYYPYIEYSYLDISNVDWESYHRKYDALLEALKQPSPQVTQGDSDD